MVKVDFKDSGAEFLKAFMMVNSDKIKVHMIREDRSVLADLPGQLAEGDRFLILPTMHRLYIEPTVYRDGFTGRKYAYVYEQNIRCIDLTEYGKTREAVQMSTEAYKIYKAQVMRFLNKGSNLLALILLIAGFFSGVVAGLAMYWVML